MRKQANIGLSVTDLERFIMKFLLVVMLVMFSAACNENSHLYSVEDQKYEIICKHPLGSIVRYPVSFNTFWSPHNNAGGIFRFKTTDGRIVRSSFCHGEAIH